jgi:predicted HTH transcriptional regulator
MLPTLPTLFRQGDQFPYVEGQQFEFKATHMSCEVRKLYETMCAFLNAAGGYIVIGVNDKGCIKGIPRAGVDTILLHVDNIFHTKVLYTATTHELVQIGEIRAHSYPLMGAIDQYIVVITVCEMDSETVYKLSTGEVFIRLNASNYRAQAGRRMDMDRLQAELTRAVAECHTLRRTLTVVQRSNAMLVAKVKGSIRESHEAREAMLDMQRVLHARILEEKAAAEKSLGGGGETSLCSRVFGWFGYKN